MMEKTIFLHGGWDLIGFSWDIPIGETYLNNHYLEPKLEEMREKREDIRLIQIGDMEFKLRIYKMRGRFFLQNDLFSLFSNTDVSPTLTGQLSSFGVHKYGHNKLWDLLNTFAKSLRIDPYAYDLPKIYRADFNTDLHVPDFYFTPYNVSSRAKRRGMFFDNYIQQNALTVGVRSKETAYLRIYDKLLEMEKKDNLWFQEVLESFPNYNPDLPVCRFEFELGKNYLRRKEIVYWDDIKSRGGHLAKYLFQKQVKLVDSDYAQNLTNRHRAPLLPEWAVIQEWINKNFDGDPWFLVGLTKKADAFDAMNNAQRRVVSAISLLEATSTAYLDGTVTSFNLDKELEKLKQLPSDFDYQREVKKKYLKYKL